MDKVCYQRDVSGEENYGKWERIILMYSCNKNEGKYSG